MLFDRHLLRKTQFQFWDLLYIYEVKVKFDPNISINWSRKLKDHINVFYQEFLRIWSTLPKLTILETMFSTPISLLQFFFKYYIFDLSKITALWSYKKNFEQFCNFVICYAGILKNLCHLSKRKDWECTNE